jgi:hypothetical protein
MTVANINKIKGDVLDLSLRANPPSVNIIDNDSIPDDYRKIIPESWQPDKISILKAFKDNGEIVSGCEIITDKKTLVIK